MNIFKKILGAALVVTFATGLAISSASAQVNNNQQPRTGIYPALLAPVGIAALVGTGTTTWSSVLTKKLFFHKFNWYGWHQTYNLHKAGYKLQLNKYGKWVKVKGKKTVHHSKSSKSNLGKAVVGCIMGSAFGAITASMRKATALGNPPRWRSQAEHERIVASGVEKQYELTSNEASIALSACGIGSLFLRWPQNAS